MSLVERDVTRRDEMSLAEMSLVGRHYAEMSLCRCGFFLYSIVFAHLSIFFAIFL